MVELMLIRVIQRGLAANERKAGCRGIVAIDFGVEIKRERRWEHGAVGVKDGMRHA